MLKKALIACALVPAMVATAQAQKFEMKVGFVTVNDSQHDSAKFFAAELKKRVGDAINVRIFPLGQLGKIPRQIEGIQLGTQEAFISPPGFFVGINQAFQAPDAPGLFDTFEHQHRTLNHPLVREKFLALAERAGIVGNYVWSAGKTAVASRDKIEKLGDFGGKKLRVLATKMEQAVMKELGATGIPMPFGEVLPAIQRRTIDGARSGVIVMGPFKFYTTAKFLYNDSMGYIPSGMWMNKKFVDKLPANLRTAVFESGKAITDATLESAARNTEKWEKLWVKNGGTVIEPTAADKAELRKRLSPLGDQFLGQNPKVKEMYDLVKQAAAATKGKS